jgi:hypothetical protein
VGGGMMGRGKGWATPSAATIRLHRRSLVVPLGSHQTYRSRSERFKEPQKNLPQGRKSVISLVHRSVPVDRVKSKTADRSGRSPRPTYICVIVIHGSNVFRRRVNRAI